MIGALRKAIEDLEVPLDGDALAEVLKVVDLLNAKVAAAIGAFDAEALWELDGATSMTAWLRHHARMTASTAKSTASTAKKLRGLPLTEDYWLSGRLSGGQVQAIVRNATAEFPEHEAAVVPALVDLSVAGTALAMQQWKAMLDIEPTFQRGVHLSQTLEGQWDLTGSLDPLGGETVATALRLAMVDEPEVPPARRRADALIDVCRFFLDHHAGSLGGRHRPHLNVVVDYEALRAGRGGSFVGGGLIDGASMQALACDAAIHRVVTDGRSTILDYGTSTRTIPAPLWSALVLRDRHCRFDGCDRPSHWCEAHHVVPWQNGGRTSLANLVLKCSRHHHLGHQPGWSEKLQPDGTLVITDPRGRTRTTRPPGSLSDLQRAS
ncbi:MAG TPA: DUF222 domain-containing protein [Acidimicrobiales bacterium]|nr:DUF222 domain-containing protein [Acidimicrobiales bacterium]